MVIYFYWFSLLMCRHINTPKRCTWTLFAGGAATTMVTHCPVCKPTVESRASACSKALLRSIGQCQNRHKQSSALCTAAFVAIAKDRLWPAFSRTTEHADGSQKTLEHPVEHTGAHLDDLEIRFLENSTRFVCALNRVDRRVHPKCTLI